MNAKIFKNKYCLKFIDLIVAMNKFADIGDPERNYITYGQASFCAEVLRNMGFKIRFPRYTKNGCFACDDITIDNQDMDFYG